MEANQLTDPLQFTERVRPLLLSDEARHNVLFGICESLTSHPEIYTEFHLWVVEDAGEVVACAIMTPPYNLLVSKPKTTAGIIALARALRVSQVPVPVPGVSGSVPEVNTFASAWSSATGVSAEVEMRLRIWELRSVREDGDVPGRLREATPSDRDLVLNWAAAFTSEADPMAREDDRRVERLTLRLRKEGGGFYLWEDPEPVSLLGYGGFTPNGVRIGPVYTPPEHRAHGYATSLTAGASRKLLQRGRRLCFLYTDLANPTSNRIYARIGYQPVCDSIQYRFTKG